MLKGGNAVDAAIATMVCDGALCPEYMGLGGGFLMSVYNATTKKVMSINARETAPAAADAHMFKENPISSVIGKCGVRIARAPLEPPDSGGPLSTSLRWTSVVAVWPVARFFFFLNFFNHQTCAITI